jgi:hypothetical protein
MDINLSALGQIAEAHRADRADTGLHVRNEDAYFAEFGSEWQVPAWAWQIIAIARRLRFTRAAARHVSRLAQA